MSRARDTANQINRVNSSAADATAITVDSSENVLVGKTTIATGTAGIALRSNGEVRGTANGDYAARFSRLSSDGAIVGFEKDGAAIGSIGSVSGVDLFVAGNRGAGQRYLLDNILPCNSAGAVNNGDIDLGTADYKYRDLFLGGGIHLGGGGSANKLDDYETGTFTPYFAGTGSNPTVSYSVQFGTYVKIGKLVYVNVSVIASGTPSSGGGDLIIAGLPFTSKSGVQQAGSIAFANNISFGNSATQGYCNIEGGVSYLNINSQEFVGTSSMSRVPTSGIQNSSPRIVCSICYETS